MWWIMALCIVASVEAELSQVMTELNTRLDRTLGGCALYVGHVGQNPIYLATVGVGIVSSAIAMGCLLASVPVSQVIMTGSAGALPDSGLTEGDLAVASSETMAELGVCTGEGLGDAGSLRRFGLDQSIPLDEWLSRSLVESAQGSFHVGRGAFLTVAGASNDRAQTVARAERFRAVVENMEGYAVALAGRRFGIPVGEVRAVSNQAGVRDKSTWKLDLANERAQTVVMNYLRRSL
jgi:futalosine hydrolase